MIYRKSNIEEISYHIKQLEFLKLSKNELNHINTIININKIPENEEIQDFIKKNITNIKNFDDIDIITNFFLEKIKKDNSLKENIEECKNFMLFRILETKCSNVNLEVFKQLSGWIFNEVNKQQERTKWVNIKFQKLFEYSSFSKKLENYLDETNKIDMNLNWLYKNQKNFYSDIIFNNQKSIVLEEEFSFI